MFKKKKQEAAADRRRAGIQTAWRDSGIDPSHLACT